MVYDLDRFKCVNHAAYLQRAYPLLPSESGFLRQA